MEQKYSTIETIAISYFKQKKQDTVTQKTKKEPVEIFPRYLLRVFWKYYQTFFQSIILI